MTTTTPPRGDLPLTPRQARFVEEYVIDLNGLAAAIRAGYARKGAEVTASKLLRVPKVKNEIDAHLATRSERAEVTKDYLITTLQGVYAKAVKEQHYNGSARLGELLAKLNGHIIEKRDVRVIKSVEDMTDEELAAVTAAADQQDGRVH